MKLRPVIKFNQTCRASLTRIENENSSSDWWAIPRLPTLFTTGLPIGLIVVLSQPSRLHTGFARSGLRRTVSFNFSGKSRDAAQRLVRQHPTGPLPAKSRAFGRTEISRIFIEKNKANGPSFNNERLERWLHLFAKFVRGISQTKFFIAQSRWEARPDQTFLRTIASGFVNANSYMVWRYRSTFQISPAIKGLNKPCLRRFT